MICRMKERYFGRELLSGASSTSTRQSSDKVAAHPLRGVGLFLVLAVSPFLASVRAADTPATNAPAQRARPGVSHRPLSSKIGRSEQGVDVLAVAPAVQPGVRHQPAREHHGRGLAVESSTAVRFISLVGLSRVGKGRECPAIRFRANLLAVPVYCEGRTRAGRGFAALFPIGAEIRDFFLLDDLSSSSFPST